MTLVVLCS